MFFLHDKTKKNNNIGSLDTDTFFFNGANSDGVSSEVEYMR